MDLRPTGPLPDSRSSGGLSSSPSSHSVKNLSLISKHSSEEKRHILTGIPIFKGVPSEKLKKVVDRVTQVNLADGKTLFEKGAVNDAVYFVCQGAIAVVVNLVGVFTLGVNEMLGDMTLFSDEPRTATTIASGDTVLLKIPRKKFEKLMEKNTDIFMGVISILLAKVKKCNEEHPGQIEKQSSGGSPMATPSSASSASDKALTPSSGAQPSPKKTGEISKSDAIAGTPSVRDDLAWIKDRVETIFKLSNEIVNAEQQIVLLAAKSARAEAKQKYMISKRDYDLKEVESESNDTLRIRDKQVAKAKDETHYGNLYAKTKAEELKVSQKQAHDKNLLQQKFHALFKFLLNGKLSLSECLKLLYAAAALKELKDYYLLLKPVCDQYLKEESQREEYKTYQRALVLFELTQISATTSVRKNVLDQILARTELLRKSDLFSQIPFIQRLKIALTCEEVVVKEGDTICKKGDPGHCMYIIQSGFVKVHNETEDDKIVEVMQSRKGIIAEFKEGHCFGELALLQPNGTRSASVTAATASVLLKISAASFKEVLESNQNQQMLKAIYRELTLMLKKFNDSRLAAETQQRLPRSMTSKEPGRVAPLDLRLSETKMAKLKQHSLDESDVFTAIEGDDVDPKESNRLSKKELAETRKKLEHLWKEDKDFERVLELLPHIYNYKVDLSSVSFENLKIPLSEIPRTFIPAEQVNFNKITVKDDIFFSEASDPRDIKRFDKKEFFEQFIFKLLPASADIPGQVVNLINMPPNADEKQYLLANPIESVSLLKAGTYSCNWSPVDKLFRESLLPTYFSAPFKGACMQGAEVTYKEVNQKDVSFKALTAENFTVVIQRKIVIEEASPDPLKKNSYAVIPVHYIITRAQGKWTLGLEFPKEIGIEPGSDIKLYIRILEELLRNLARLHQ